MVLPLWHGSLCLQFKHSPIRNCIRDAASWRHQQSHLNPFLLSSLCVVNAVELCRSYLANAIWLCSVLWDVRVPCRLLLVSLRAASVDAVSWITLCQNLLPFLVPSLIVYFSGSFQKLKPSFLHLTLISLLFCYYLQWRLMTVKAPYRKWPNLAMWVFFFLKASLKTAVLKTATFKNWSRSFLGLYSSLSAQNKWTSYRYARWVRNI